MLVLVWAYYPLATQVRQSTTSYRRLSLSLTVSVYHPSRQGSYRHVCQDLHLQVQWRPRRASSWPSSITSRLGWLSSSNSTGRSLRGRSKLLSTSQDRRWRSQQVVGFLLDGQRLTRRTSATTTTLVVSCLVRACKTKSPKVHTQRSCRVRASGPSVRQCHTVGCPTLLRPKWKSSRTIFVRW